MLYYDVLNSPAKLVPAPPRFNEMESIFIRYTGSIFADEMQRRGCDGCSADRAFKCRQLCIITPHLNALQRVGSRIAWLPTRFAE